MNSNPMSGPAKGASDTVAIAGRDRAKDQKAANADDEGRTFGAVVDEAGKKISSKAEGPAAGGRANAASEATGGPVVRPDGLSRSDGHSLPRQLEPPVLRTTMPAEAGEKAKDNAVPARPGQPTDEENPVEAKSEPAPKTLQEADIPVPAKTAEKTNAQAPSVQQSAAERAMGVVAAQTMPVRQNNARGVEPAKPANANMAPFPDTGPAARETQQPARETQQPAGETHQPARDTGTRTQQDAGIGAGGKSGPDIFAFAADRNASKSLGASMPQPTADQAPTPSPGTVTVVAARQFPGLSVTQSSAASVINAMTGDGRWSQMLRGAEAVSATTLNTTQNTMNTLKIQLNPAELGTVDATLKLSGGRLVVELNAQTLEAYRHLSDSQQHILKAMKGQGYAVEQISVQHTVQDRGIVQQFSQSAGQGAGDSATQSGQNNSAENGSGSRPGRQDDGSHGGERPLGHEGPEDDPGRAVSDAVYL